MFWLHNKEQNALIMGFSCRTKSISIRVASSEVPSEKEPRCNRCVHIVDTNTWYHIIQSSFPDTQVESYLHRYYN